jgi:hypothetical protein
MRHSRANGTSANSPASWAAASPYDASGISGIASISRMASGYDISRRRSPFLSLPASSTAAMIASITPSPRWRSRSPNRAKSDSRAPARTLPSLQITAWPSPPAGRTPPVPRTGEHGPGHDSHVTTEAETSDPQHDSPRRRPGHL